MVSKNGFVKGVFYCPSPKNQRWNGDDMLLWINDGDNAEFNLKDGELMCLVGENLYKDNPNNRWQFDDTERFLQKKATVSTMTFNGSCWTLEEMPKTRFTLTQ